MRINVIQQAKRNIVFGALNKSIVMICPFIERMVIQNVLGSLYLGLGSLYSAIISVLSLSELGFSSAMVYNMYKPAADGDIKKMNALLSFYRKVYRIVGLIILALGIAIIPFLPSLVKGDTPPDIKLVNLYLIYLGNTAISYFLFAYMSSVIVVHQRDDVKSNINSILKISLVILQIAILLMTKNYYLFTLLMPLFTIANNILIAVRVHRLFPQYKPEGELSLEDKLAIKKLVAGSFVHRACGMSRNSLDSLCISTLFGLSLTAEYNNYYLVCSGVTGFVALFSTAFTGGVGNHVATKSVEENYNEMKRLDFVYLWIGGWCAICMLCLYQPFMELWMGKNMRLSNLSVFLFCIYFYLLKLGDIRLIYTAANGLWWEQRYRAIAETIMNLVLNIILGKQFGVEGIIIATSISLFLCNYLWSVDITFRAYFSSERKKDYYHYQAKQSMVTFVVGLLTCVICMLLPLHSVLLQLIIRGLICVIVPNTCFYLVYRHSELFLYAKHIIKQ